jgi:hypothetical protein
MKEWINWPLISNPANWLIVFMMIASASIVITVIHASWSPAPNR